MTADLAASYRKAVRARCRRPGWSTTVSRRAAGGRRGRRRPPRGATPPGGDGGQKAIKGTRYALLKHPARLKPSQAHRLAITAPGEPGPRPRLRVEGVPGDHSRAGQTRRGRRATQPVAGLGGALALGAVRQAGAHDPQARGRDSCLPRHPDDQRSGRGHHTSSGSSHGAPTASTRTVRSSRCSFSAVEAFSWRHRYPHEFEETRFMRLRALVHSKVISISVLSRCPSQCYHTADISTAQPAF